MIVVDGAQGEGGGQIVRAALALSLATGTPFRIERVRAGRPKPGLQRQHLAAVEAAAAVGEAEVEGAALGSAAFTFGPRALRPGNYRFDVGSAGSATLVLQTILPALIGAPEPSKVTVDGGTHNPWAPPFDFLDRVFAPALRAMGADFDLELVRHGFYPAGGGAVRARVRPSTLGPPEILERGKVLGRLARAMVSQLPDHVAERELREIRRRLQWHKRELRAERVESPGPGNVVMLEVACEGATELATAFGARGLRAEAVAARAAEEIATYLAADAPVGAHLADQLLVPLALAGAGAFRTGAITDHARTCMAVVTAFTGRSFEVRKAAGGTWEVRLGV